MKAHEGSIPTGADLVRDEGPTKLADGTRLMSCGWPTPRTTPTSCSRSLFLVTIRDDNHTGRVDLGWSHQGGRSSRSATPRPPDTAIREFGWDLAGLKPAIEKDKDAAKSPVRTLADMLRPNVTVEEMAKRADYPVYIFGQRSELVGPAADRGHPGLAQPAASHVRRGVSRQGQAACRARAGPYLQCEPGTAGPLGQAAVHLARGHQGVAQQERPDRWRRSSCRASAAPASSRARRPRTASCYLLETPEGTFPALAVNGALTDAELHGLVDSLERAKPN